MTTISEQAICRICNRRFTREYDPAHPDAGRYIPTVCYSCGEELDAGWSPEALIAKHQGIVTKTPFRCPDAFLDTEISKLPDQPAYNRAIVWQYGEKGMVFHGKSGGGKSRTLWLLLNRLSNEGVDFMAIGGAKFATAAADAYRNGWGSGWMHKMETVPLLALDDIGVKGAQGQRGEASLFEVIKNRGEAKLPTIITSQRVGEDIIALFNDKDTAEALVRRLREPFCESIEFHAPPEAR